MAKKGGLYFTKGVKSKALRIPDKGFLSMVDDVKKKNWAPKVSI